MDDAVWPREDRPHGRTRRDVERQAVRVDKCQRRLDGQPNERRVLEGAQRYEDAEAAWVVRVVARRVSAVRRHARDRRPTPWRCEAKLVEKSSVKAVGSRELKSSCTSPPTHEQRLRLHTHSHRAASA